MSATIWYMAERILLLSAVVGIAGYAIYQWKVARVKPALLAKFQKEAEAAVREKMAAENAEHEAVIEDYKRRIKNADIWLKSRQRDSWQLVADIKEDFLQIRKECQRYDGASRNLIEVVKLIDGMSRNKHFMESMTKAKKSRIQSESREAKAELKAVEQAVSSMKERIAKAESYIEASGWKFEEPPKLREEEPDHDDVD